MQILNACKCLFVSHRKIAIYLQSLNAEKKKKTASLVGSSVASVGQTGVLNESTNTINNNNNNSNNESMMSGNSLTLSKTIGMEDETSTLQLLDSSCSSVKTCKLTLSDIRIPLSWKYSEHLKAAKNSGIYYILKNF